MLKPDTINSKHIYEALDGTVIAECYHIQLRYYHTFKMRGFWIYDLNVKTRRYAGGSMCDACAEYNRAIKTKYKELKNGTD